jgi:mannose-6-phosphate isomerase-like protein (cupin superfamily)
MTMADPGYDRGWKRFGFDTMDFSPQRVHSGAGEVDVAIAIDRGVGMPFVAYVVVPPGVREAPPLGMHVHRSQILGRDVEEWYIIIDGTGIQRFTNGDSVEFGPGDLIAVYPGTGHSLEVTGDRPVKMLGVMTELFQRVHPDHAEWPESWQPRIRVLTTTDTLNPTVAECTDCGETWERPDGDAGSNTLPVWAAEHECNRQAAAVHLSIGERA